MTTPYMSTELLQDIDTTDTTVTREFDQASWDMVTALALSQQLTTGKVLLDLADAGNEGIVVCTADLGRPTQVINFGRR